MTEKRFIEPDKECRVIKNTKTGETATYYDTIDGLMFLKWLNNLSDETEKLKDEVYDELDNTLTVLTELYEVIPISSQSKMNSLYNRLKSLRDDIK